MIERERELLSKISTKVNDPSKYNIFNVLGVAAKEVVMCRFLAYSERQRYHDVGVPWSWLTQGGERSLSDRRWGTLKMSF